MGHFNGQSMILGLCFWIFTTISMENFNDDISPLKIESNFNDGLSPVKFERQDSDTAFILKIGKYLSASKSKFDDLEIELSSLCQTTNNSILNSSRESEFFHKIEEILNLEEKEDVEKKNVDKIIPKKNKLNTEEIK